MKITYSLNRLHLWEVEENSLMDRVLRDIQQKARQSWNRECRALIDKGLPVYVNKKQHRDILFDVERT